MQRLGLAAEDSDTQRMIRSLYLQKWRQAHASGQPPTKADLDRLLAEAATEVTGSRSVCPSCAPNSPPRRSRARPPLKVDFDASGAMGDIGEYLWDFGGGKYRRVCKICNCDIPPAGGITTFQEVLYSPYWFNLDSAFQSCFEPVIDDHLSEYHKCFLAWSIAPEVSANQQLDQCLTKLDTQTGQATRLCQGKACERSCAAIGKLPRIRSLLGQECACVAR